MRRIGGIRLHLTAFLLGVLSLWIVAETQAAQHGAAKKLGGPNTCNQGFGNTDGCCNYGDFNRGAGNKGSNNHGDYNIGNNNVGRCNVGSNNVGSGLVGDGLTGHHECPPQALEMMKGCEGMLAGITTLLNTGSQPSDEAIIKRRRELMTAMGPSTGPTPRPTLSPSPKQTASPTPMPTQPSLAPVPSPGCNSCLVKSGGRPYTCTSPPKTYVQEPMYPPNCSCPPSGFNCTCLCTLQVLPECLTSALNMTYKPPPLPLPPPPPPLSPRLVPNLPHDSRGNPQLARCYSDDSNRGEAYDPSKSMDTSTPFGLAIFNCGNGNRGNCNTGNGNQGDCNQGNGNAGTGLIGNGLQGWNKSTPCPSCCQGTRVPWASMDTFGSRQLYFE